MNTKTTLKSLLLKELQTGELHYSTLENICKANNFKISNGERRMRELGQELDLVKLTGKSGAIIKYSVKPIQTGLF